MHNPEAIEYITKNYKQLKRIWATNYSPELIEDAIQNVAIAMLRKERELDNGNLKAYIEISIKHELGQFGRKRQHLNYDLPYGDSEDPLSEVLPNPECEFEILQDQEEIKYNFTKLTNYMEVLTEKQRGAVETFLKNGHHDFTASNYETTKTHYAKALVKLNELMLTGTLVDKKGRPMGTVRGRKEIPAKITTGKVRGVPSKFTSEQLATIRGAALWNGDRLLNATPLAKEYGTTRQTITNIIKGKTHSKL
jgi:hypothetical protein